MTNENLKLEITEQIAKSRLFNNSLWSIKYFEGINRRDRASLEGLRKKINRDYKFNSTITFAIAILLMAGSLLRYFDLIDFVNMNKAGLLILFAFVFATNTFKLNEIKVKLDNHIFLLRMLEKIETKTDPTKS